MERCSVVKPAAYTQKTVELLPDYLSSRDHLLERCHTAAAAAADVLLQL